MRGGYERGKGKKMRKTGMKEDLVGMKEEREKTGMEEDLVGKKKMKA